jgi:5-methylcytosine-specific restriction endonuclease McrA
VVNTAHRQAKRYAATSPHLSGFRSELKSKATKRWFSRLYKSGRDAVVQLADQIKASSLNRVTANACQYCGGLAQPKTLDHYLAKAEIPELSVYRRNLVPCCYECNNVRGKTFTVGGERRILHFFDDDVAAVPDLLFAAIAFANAEPVATFDVSPSTDALGMVYRRHFVALRLAKRYSVSAGGQFEELKNMYAYSNITQAALIGELNDDIAMRRRTYGSNDYLTALYAAIAGSPQALNWVQTP